MIFLGWYRILLTMVHDKAGLPKPLPFLKALGMETVEVGRFSVWWRMKVGQGLPAAEELSLPLLLLLGLGVQGPYSLEAMWTVRSTTLLL